MSEQPDKLCDYCKINKAKGYVKAYDAYVCEECYEDEHGPTIG